MFVYLNPLASIRRVLHRKSYMIILHLYRYLSAVKKVFESRLICYGGRFGTTLVPGRKVGPTRRPAIGLLCCSKDDKIGH